MGCQVLSQRPSQLAQQALSFAAENRWPVYLLYQIRIQAPQEISSSDGVEKPKDTRLRKISAKDTLQEGAVLCIPAAVSESLYETNSATNVPKIALHDIKYLRSTILHKDAEIIVINKPSGLAVQGGSDVVKSLDSMMEAALSYNYNEGPRLVHRLDKETSGALVLGRTHQSTVFLQALLRNKTEKISQAPGGKVVSVERCYLALVIGVPEKKEGRISAPLAKVVSDSGKLDKMRVVHGSHPNAQEAITDYKVLGSSLFGCSWLELRPLTGRKHQIRVHCAEVLGMPIVGDYKYGWRALRLWPPTDRTEDTKSSVLGLRESGHVWSSKPYLHLHCRQLILPDVAQAFKSQSRERSSAQTGARVSGSQFAEPLEIIAPLPPHMVVSWNMKPLNDFPMI
ncbi:RNA pseudouridine synthase 4, mitochondrial isoform X2 [Physcomitrium patens]|uniref:RNA pseudouridine synthase 4, mitochondrial isoform X2 n=1 Tax=Physcomitrium patens TaxID=3218 RepID=UPI000D17C292|nr:RNA pseudouridine synthase 4, mitochondrial-like isoform X2 [Physcomitrium patens]|eukprot:XP_024380379.1 RNA pseudouridine synthase 4, mitochondrial-like isoform X2 [Physcomitrella patens]